MVKQLDCPTHDDHDDDDAVEPVDSYQAHNDPAVPDSDDGDDVQHEHDTSISNKAEDTSDANEAAGLDAIALFADTMDNVQCLYKMGINARHCHFKILGTQLLWWRSVAHLATMVKELQVNTVSVDVSIYDHTRHEIQHLEWRNHD